MPVLAQKTILDQIEMKADPVTGNIVNVFRQDLLIVTMDGAEIARNFHRSAYVAADPAATALLGAATAGNLATIATLQAQLADAEAQIVALTQQLDQAQAQA